MARVLIPTPAPITEEDWQYYLGMNPGGFILQTIESLRNENRFFVDERFLKLIYTYVFDIASRYQAQRTVYQMAKIPFYRARIYKERDYEERFKNPERYNEFQGYDADNSFVPPLNASVEGRINPNSIRYLYTSSDIKTSILEVRAQPGEYVSVATIMLKEDVHLADFSKQLSSIDAASFEKARWINSFALHLGYFFFFFYVDTGDYYFCQDVSEYLKNWGFDVIAFRSSMMPTAIQNEGVNYTFFNFEKCEVKSSKLYHIVSIEVTTYPEIEGLK